MDLISDNVKKHGTLSNITYGINVTIINNKYVAYLEKSNVFGTFTQEVVAAGKDLNDLHNKIWCVMARTESVEKANHFNEHGHDNWFPVSQEYMENL